MQITKEDWEKARKLMEKEKGLPKDENGNYILRHHGFTDEEVAELNKHRNVTKRRADEPT